MKIAVLTLTRDRLSYTQHTFAKLAEFAGCDYDHWVLDQASEDGSREWLAEQPNLVVHQLDENVGIARGRNRLLDECGPDNYDVIVHFDNDCELTQPNTLRDLCRIVYESDCILSPRILGLNNPPQATRELVHDGEIILDIPQIGGIMLTAPAWVYDEYRYPDALPEWGGDDSHICAWFRARGGTCGYVKRLEAWHYRSTKQQWDDFPAYFARTQAEGKAVL